MDKVEYFAENRNGLKHVLVIAGTPIYFTSAVPVLCANFAELGEGRGRYDGPLLTQLLDIAHKTVKSVRKIVKNRVENTKVLFCLRSKLWPPGVKIGKISRLSRKTSMTLKYLHYLWNYEARENLKKHSNANGSPHRNNV